MAQVGQPGQRKSPPRLPAKRSKPAGALSQPIAPIVDAYLILGPPRDICTGFIDGKQQCGLLEAFAHRGDPIGQTAAGNPEAVARLGIVQPNNRDVRRVVGRVDESPAMPSTLAGILACMRGSAVLAGSEIGQ